LLSIGALALVVVLFQLPKVVVENDQLQVVLENKESHELQIPLDVQSRMSDLRRMMSEEENLDKKTNFAHSLARYYLDYGVLDSAVSIGAEIESWSNSPSKLVMDIYFKAFERSQNQSDVEIYSAKAKSIIEKLMDKDPSNLLLKNKLAMTLVISENPMAGIALLREILAEDENNRQAILNLGLLAIQSGQFARAKERFEKLVSLNPTDQEARLYLAVSMIEINEQSQARLLLEEILSSKDSIPVIKTMASDYLNGL
jgi:tetratricopeptide (TPR) repeat protein